ncbi:uncharacterized protein BN752_01280 [Alistipes putredinis CAG:67]|jgi:hypothetical protein|nr:uncharacterized protein BN752_01280 [Alistipes putredinis CAG:67]
MEDKCTKFISLSVSRSGQISGPGVPLSVAARIGEDAERAERNFRHGGPVFRTFRKTVVLQDAARAGSTDRRSERMRKALVDFAAQGEEMLIKFGLSLTFPYL